MISRLPIQVAWTAALVVAIAQGGGAQAAAIAAARTSPAASSQKRPVSVEEFSWLAGSWDGTLSGMPGAIAEVVFQPPRGGTVTGVMRLTRGGALLVVELISLIDTPRGVELRFRHFNGALDALEPTFKQTMLLKTHDATKYTFENLVGYDKTLMSTQPRVASWTQRGPDEMIAHSDIIGSDGTPAVVEVTYRRRPWR